MDKLWSEVLGSNLSKLNQQGELTKNEMGKVLKPDGYYKPDIEGVLDEAVPGDQAPA